MTDQRLHILFLPKWYPNPDNVQSGIFIRKHAKAIAEYADVTVLYPHPIEGKSHGLSGIVEDQRDGFLEVFVYYKKGNWQPLNFIRYARAFLKGIKRIKERSGKPGLVHAHVLLRTAVAALYLKCRYGWPYIISEHWSGYINGKFSKQHFIKKMFSRLAVRQAEAVTVVSSKLKEGMKNCGLRSNFTVIPNVVEAPPGNILRKEFEKIQVLVVADLKDRIKNISGILEAFYSVQKEHGGLQLQIIGGGPDEKPLRAKAENLGLLENGAVYFHGEQPNAYVLGQLVQADFVVINSRVETFSVVAAEALAAGKPVISTKCGGPEDLINQKNGLLVEVGDTHGLAAALSKMAGIYKQYDPNELKADIEGKFSYRSVGRQFFKLYRSILEK